jgi:hypothetical protein
MLRMGFSKDARPVLEVYRIVKENVTICDRKRTYERWDPSINIQIFSSYYPSS